MQRVKTIIGGCAVAVASLSLTLPLFSKDVSSAAKAPAKPAAQAPAKPVAAAKVAPAPAPGEKIVQKRPLIQIAILLDTSNSMDGLISQAKTHLWTIVNEFVAARQK